MGGGKAHEDVSTLHVDVAELSVHDDDVKPSIVDVTPPVEAASLVEPAKPAVWKPRWKTDNSILPTAYGRGSTERVRGAKKPRAPLGPLPPGTYRSSDIARHLNCDEEHSFLKKRVPYTTDTVERHAESALPEEIAAIMFHHGANPIPASHESYEIWTRHYFDTIKNHQGVLPLFIYTMEKKSLYEYGGTYRIADAEVMKGRSKEVVDFIRERAQSQNPATAEAWNNKLSSDWLKVTVVRVPEKEQKENPMLNAEKAE